MTNRIRKRSFLYVLTGAFLVIGFACLLFSRDTNSDEELAEDIVAHVRDELAYVQNVERETDWSDSLHYTEVVSRYPFYIYEDNRLRYWHDNAYVPVYNPSHLNDSIFIHKGNNSTYIARTFRVKNNLILFLIPLQKNYPIENSYLQTQWNKHVFGDLHLTLEEACGAIGIPIVIDNQCLFNVAWKDGYTKSSYALRVASVLWILLGLVLFTVVIYLDIKRRRQFELGFLFLLIYAIAIRCVMIYTEFPQVLLSLPIFDARIFAASWINASLGDFFINLVIIACLCAYIFTHYPRFLWLRSFAHNRVGRWCINLFAFLAIYYAWLHLVVVIQTIYNNSELSLDITESLAITTFRVLAFGSVLTAGISAFLFTHVFVRLLFTDKHIPRIVVSFVIASLLFSLFNLWTSQVFISSYLLTTCYLVVVYALGLTRSLQRFSFATFGYLFATIFFLSANSALAIDFFSRKNSIKHQFKFANDYLIDRDYFAEYLLSETSKKISEDAFIQMRIASPFLGRDAIRQKIRQVFLSSYFNRFDVDMHIFNAAGELIDGGRKITLSELLAQHPFSIKTSYDGIYMDEVSSDASRRYVVISPVSRNSLTIGYVVIELVLKKVIPENVYPELLVDNRFQLYYRGQEYSYAIYANGKIILQSGEFNYENKFDRDWLIDPAMHTTGLSKLGYDHIVQEDENGRFIVVSAKESSRGFAMANFSFWLTIGIAIILFYIIITGCINLIRGEHLYYATRIQLFLNLAFFVPLLIVSAVTLTLINKTTREQLQIDYMDKAKVVGDQLSATFGNREHVPLNVRDRLFNKLTELSQFTQLDLNVYDASGNLAATNQPVIYERGLISHLMDYRALKRVHEGDEVFVSTASIGNLSYSISYRALKSQTTGNLIGVLAIPFFQSAASLEQVQITLLSNILNIFAFIFVGLTIVAYGISRWLTFPLTFITQSLKRTSLTDRNEPLRWNAKDEIGLMVKEYNNMLYKLSESKAALEKNQREQTWREVAQQVAHEIKNPLTPMKLTLQQLERNIDQGTNSIEKTQKAVRSLLTQVDTLNDIASSFSTFAKMPEPKIESIDLGSLLQRIVDLHHHAGNISYHRPSESIVVKADEQLLGRTMSNIILNAFQSERVGVPLVLSIELALETDYVTVLFNDNGSGMSTEVADRVFYPHFTTKQSGSGLGLAIAKQAIERMQGEIYFKTLEGEGTTFYLKLLRTNP